MDTSTPNASFPEFSGAQGGADPKQILEHSEWLRSFALALVKDEAVAADLVQDALVSVGSAGSRVTSVRGYLAQSVRNLATKHRRGEARRRAREEARARDGAVYAPSADELAERIDTLRVCMEELRSLDAVQQRALSLRYLEGLSPTEIAERDGIPATTVRSHIARGLAALREKLDRRLGGREAWSAVLVPWIGGAKLAAIGSLGEFAVSAAKAEAAPAALGSSTAVLQAGVLVMYLKALSIVLVPVIAAGVWIRWDSSAQDLSGSRPDLLDGGQASSPMALPPEEADMVDLAKGELSNAHTRLDAGPAEQAATAALPKAQVRLVDQRTSEPVPDYFLELESLGPEIDLGSFSTGEDGGAQLPVAPAILNSVRLLGSDDHGSGGKPAGPRESTAWGEDTLEDVTPSQAALDLSDPGAVPVAVGPTFRLALTGAPLVSASDLVAYMTGPGLEFGQSMTSRVRGDGRPWVRLPADVPTVAGSTDSSGPWTLHVVHREGLAIGEAQVTRTFGIEASMVPVTLEPRGALRFRMAGGDDAPKFLSRAVQLSREDTGYSSRLMLGKRNGGFTAAKSRLRPGTYEWRYGYGSYEQRGSVDVVGGCVETLELEPPTAQDTFDVLVTVDATAASEERPERWTFWLYPIDDPTQGFTLRAKPSSTGTPHVWDVSADSVSPGPWAIRAQGPVSCAVDPTIVPISAADPLVNMIIRAFDESEMIEFVVMDKETGEPIPGAWAMHARGRHLQVNLVDETGTMPAFSVPREMATSFLIRADGYKLHRVQIPVQGTDGIVPIALEPGWRSRVWVRDVVTYESVEGVPVHVDGVLAGKTDKWGEFWLEGSGPPDRIQVAGYGGGWQVTASPLANGYTKGAAPFPGYMFTVRRD